jgi:RNA-directed DNA polymerase
VYIPKADGRQRPLGIATLEDKIVQRAVVEVLNAIYEEDFLGFSYGFRPGRSPHDALDALAVGIERKKVNWVLDADIRDFFTSLDHDWLQKFLEHRIADKRVLRLIRKWVNAGVIEDGAWTASEEGAPQGASASPLLANVYLHYVLDRWVRQWRRRHAHGDVIIVRFADDFVAGFEHKSDASSSSPTFASGSRSSPWSCIPTRRGSSSSGATPPATAARASGSRRRSTSSASRTSAGRPGRTLLAQAHHHLEADAGQAAEVKDQLKRRRHLPIPEQGQWLGSVVRGHLAYYAVPGNTDAVQAFRTQVTRHWFKALRRRSQRTASTGSG